MQSAGARLALFTLTCVRAIETKLLKSQVAYTRDREANALSSIAPDPKEKGPAKQYNVAMTVCGDMFFSTSIYNFILERLFAASSFPQRSITSLLRSDTARAARAPLCRVHYDVQHPLAVLSWRRVGPAHKR
jgi:hypothetical protein